MKRPKRLRIGHVTYAVVEDEHLLAAADAHGLWSDARQTITIKPGLGPDVDREVLLHEVLHACSYASGDPLDTESEEKAVAALAGPLLGALRDNPKLVAYLTT